MASVIVSEKNKQTQEKYVFYGSVSQIHKNPQKNLINMTICDVGPTYHT